MRSLDRERQRKYNALQEGLFALVMAFRKGNATSRQSLKTDLPTSVGGCGMGRRQPRDDIAVAVRPVDIVTSGGMGMGITFQPEADREDRGGMPPKLSLTRGGKKNITITP